MVDLVYEPAAIERLHAAVAAEARRLPPLAHRVAPPSAAAFAGLASAEGFASALAELRAVLDAELTAAATRLDAAAGALDASLGAMRAADTPAP